MTIDRSSETGTIRSTGGRSASIAIPLGSSSGPSAAFELTANARGPWHDEAAHGGAPAALLARAVELHGREGDMRLLSMQTSFLGPVTLGRIEIETELIKPGRKQMVVAARLNAGGRTLLAATGILLRRGSLELSEEAAAAACGDDPMPPREGEPQVREGIWGEGVGPAFHRTSNTIVVIEGGPDRSRPDGAAWFRLDCPLVPGEEISPAQRAAAAADFGNGLAHPIPFGEYIFVNCDLNLSLLREPAGPWIGVKSRTAVSVNGSGLTRTTLHDDRGYFGAASQALYVDLAG